MMTAPYRFLLAAACALSLAASSLPATAAAPAPDQTPPDAAKPGAAASVPDRAPADIARPVTTPRVGGSRADAEFRAVIQQSGDEYRARRAACRRLPSEEQGTCLSDARAAMQKVRADAKVAHDEAVRAERAARRQYPAADVAGPATDRASTDAARPAAASVSDRAPADITRPVTTPRVGGSPADAEFRAIIQQSGDEYRARRAACRTLPSEQQDSCLSDARAAMQKARADAKAAHDEAVRAERAARRQQ